MTDTNVINGTDVTMYVKISGQYYPIGCATSCTFDIDQEIILRTGVNDGLFPKKRVRRTDWRGSVSGVMVSNNTTDRYGAFYFIQEAVRRAENTYKWEFIDISGNIKEIEGVAVIKAIPIAAGADQFSTFDIQVEGSGAFTITDGGGSPGIVDENIDSDEWATTEGQYGVSGTSVDGKSLTGKYLLAVSRSGIAYDIITTGTVGNLQAKFVSGSGTITFDAPFNADETVWAMWKDS
jgi:hypothetical protein